MWRPWSRGRVLRRRAAAAGDAATEDSGTPLASPRERSLIDSVASLSPLSLSSTRVGVRSVRAPGLHRRGTGQLGFSEATLPCQLGATMAFWGAESVRVCSRATGGEGNFGRVTGHAGCG
jgi:hypothetical protein